MIRVIATADNHLGRYYDRMPVARLEDRRRYLRRGFHAAVECALERDAHLFLQLGDLFDAPDPRNVDREFVAHDLARLRASGVRAFGVGGNHDTPKMRTEQGGALPQGTYAQLGGLRLFEGSRTVEHEVVEVAGERVAVGGVTWNPTLRPEADPLADLDWCDWPREVDVKLLLAHCSVEGHVFPGHLEPVVSLATLDEIPDVDHVLLGHVHKHRQFRLGDRTVTMVGATERMEFGSAEGDAGFVYLELVDKEVRGLEFVRTACQPRQEITIRTTELGVEPADDVISRLEPICTQDTLVKLRLEGPLSRDLYHRLDLRRIHEYGSSRAFHLDVDTVGLYLEDEDHRSAERGIRFSQKEELELCAKELYEQATEDEERGLIQEALRAILARY